MQATFQKIIARFPERSLVLRSGSVTRYIVLKTWHQIAATCAVAVFFLWTAIASIGFSWNHNERLLVESELATTVASNKAFIAQLENDQKNAYQLRLSFDEEVTKNEYLTDLVMDMSQSVAEISGHQPPQSVQDVGAWLTEVAGDITEAYKTQSTAMEMLHDTMTATLAKGFATIDGTPLADPEFAGFSPSFGAGGPGHETVKSGHVFERFQDRSNRLMILSQDWQALRSMLECAPLSPPVDYYNLTSPYGKRRDPFTKKPAWHEGVDLGAWPGTRVRATAPGTVTFSGRKGGYGRFVIVDHGCGIETAYGHLKKIYVKKGAIVDYRETIGEVGSTGRSTGPHVHYEVRIQGKPVDPYQFIKAGRYVFKEQKLAVADAK